MRIVWDEPKRLANLAKHGRDFAELDESFFENSVITPEKGRRHIAIGDHRQAMTVVVFAVMGRKAISIVSMRPASRKERGLLR